MKKEQLCGVVDQCFATLPEGWRINILIEIGYIGVSLIDPEWNEVQIDCADMSLSERVDDALEKALAHGKRTDCR